MSVRHESGRGGGSVFSDVEGKCTRGAKEFKGEKVFLGNGIAEVDRSEIFSLDGPGK